MRGTCGLLECDLGPNTSALKFQLELSVHGTVVY